MPNFLEKTLVLGKMSFSGKERREFFYVLDLLLKEKERNDFYSELNIHGLILTLFAMIGRNGNNIKNEELIDQTTAAVQESAKFIFENYAQKITLDEAAGIAGMCSTYFSRKFMEVTGYGFSSHEAFTRAFREAYGITPSQYRRKPVPVVLRTIIRPFDCYLIENGGNNMPYSDGTVKTYFVTIPAHKFLHIRNYESIGYWDFWQKQSLIKGQDCDTICGLLNSIKGKLDDVGSGENDSGSGQLMAFLNTPEGRICSWGIPLAECYGVRLPADYDGPVPEQMILTDIPEGEYIVFEHGPFDFETENAIVEQRIEKAMKEFDYRPTGYCLDTAPGRIFYFYHDCKRFWKYVRPVRKA